MTHHSHHLHFFLQPHQATTYTASFPPSPPSSPPSPSSLNLEKEREREKEREKKEKKRESSPELVAGATVRRDHVQLATTDKHPRPPSCSSRRDEAVDTNHASIGARTKPHAPPEVSPLRAREVHAPPPKNVATAGPPSPAAGIPPSPPVTDTGDSPATRSTRPSQLNMESI
ncbi:extensin-like [Brassica napus]|uniref:extensin-like n=1 Tax=Brassica napus TaxID=3708 RepID=UPI00207A2178|nr:extensin-like [Brassica napus]